MNMKIKTIIKIIHIILDIIKIITIITDIIIIIHIVAQKNIGKKNMVKNIMQKKMSPSIQIKIDHIIKIQALVIAIYHKIL